MKIKFGSIRSKIIAFILLYSFAFYLYRTSDYYNSYRLLISNADTIPYSTIGLIFGILAAFIIQKEWEKWGSLVDAVKGENSALYEMWLWSERLLPQKKQEVRQLIKEYLAIIISEGWEKTEKGETSDELDAVIKKMHNNASDLNKSQPISSSFFFALVGNIMNFREKRILYGSSHMPEILLWTFRFTTFLMISLCPFIAVKTIELHYIFSISIALLSYILYLVAYDMDNPLKPGGWHLTTSDYKKLLDKLNKTKAN
jgi:hypothetical protein